MKKLTRLNSNKSRHQIGSSLIEVMVALFVLGAGLLGVLSMQTKGMQYNQTAYYYSQAVFLAEEIFDSIRANKDQADDYLIDFDADVPTAPNCGTGATVDCSAADLAKWDLKNWRNGVVNRLPFGESEVVKTGSEYAVTIKFDDNPDPSDGYHFYRVVTQF